MVSLRSVFTIWVWMPDQGRHDDKSFLRLCNFLILVEYLNFSHFRHFTILVISFGNLIFTQQDFVTQCKK